MIYVAKNKDFIKLGYSKNPERRLKEHNIKLRLTRPLKFISFFPLTIQHERYIHFHLNKFRINTEFSITPTELYSLEAEDFILNLCKKHEKNPSLIYEYAYPQDITDKLETIFERI